MTWNPIAAPFTLKQGTQYACTVDQPFYAPDSVVISRFVSAGFINVQRDKTDTTQHRYTGTWGQPDQADVSLPSQVLMVLEWDA